MAAAGGAIGPRGDDKYHFDGLDKILLQLFVIIMGVDYDSYAAVLGRPGDCQL